eukprot:7376861-Prymnesium_polylepis.1
MGIRLRIATGAAAANGPQPSNSVAPRRVEWTQDTRNCHRPGWLVARSWSRPVVCNPRIRNGRHCHLWHRQWPKTRNSKRWDRHNLGGRTRTTRHRKMHPA